MVVVFEADQGNTALDVDEMIDGLVAATDEEGLDASGGHTQPSSAGPASQFDQLQKSLTAVVEKRKLCVFGSGESQDQDVDHHESPGCEEGRSAWTVGRKRNRLVRPWVTFEMALEAVSPHFHRLKSVSYQAFEIDRLAWSVKPGMLMRKVQKCCRSSSSLALASEPLPPLGL